MKIRPCLIALCACFVNCKQPARTEIPGLTVPRSLGEFTLDGELREPAWQRAARTGPLVDTLTGNFENSRNARGEVRALWTSEGLILGWEVQDQTSVLRTGLGTDSHLWENDCVEVMLDPGGDGHDYFEIQVDPAGNVFDTSYRDPRIPRPFGLTAWSSGLRRGVRVTREGYTVEMLVPWSALGVANPDENTVLRGNFYLMDKTPRGQLFAGWSPVLVGDFHVPQRFGRIRLGR